MINEHTVANDLRTITRLATLQGHPTADSGLGGAYGYGTELDTPTFSMHPYCWCEEPTCPWCRTCACPYEGTHRYHLADGTQVTGEAFYDTPIDQRGTVEPVPENQCDNCRNPQPTAPNFHHKPTGVQVRWYKYIGRGMEIDCPDQETWDQVFLDTLKHLTPVPDDSEAPTWQGPEPTCIRLTCDHPAGTEPEGHVQCDDEGPRGKLCTLHPGHDGNHQDGGTQWHY